MPFLCCDGVKKVNKTELKNFAIQSRRKLIEQVQTKALLYGIDEINSLEIQEKFGQLMINDKPYPLYMKSAFNSLRNQLEQKGFKQLIEEVAYTWFNRIIAIRYMEVHDYLPERVNVLSSSVGRIDPDILFEYETMDLSVKQEGIRELLNIGDTEGAYRQLFIAQCNALNSILPFLFEEIQDYTELLLPDFLLDAESVIKVLVQKGELTNSFEEIEVIGWLYQYYIAEEKDRVFAQKSKYKKEEIPFATQLFTPKWIVQYMVDNSLGDLWIREYPKSCVKDELKYYIKPIEINQGLVEGSNFNIENIKFLDPACGSGHILVYAFDLFYKFYEERGYSNREIPKLILENNLYGLDIDQRAAHLSSFALIMKAREKYKRLFSQKISLNVCSFKDTKWLSEDLILKISNGDSLIFNELVNIKAIFDNCQEIGSLLSFKPIEVDSIRKLFVEYINSDFDLFEVNNVSNVEQNVSNLLKQLEILNQRYDVVCTNPPYMGSSNMSDTLKLYVKKEYDIAKADLCTCFIEASIKLTKIHGYCSLVTMHSWLFLSAFEELRKKIVTDLTINSILHLGMEAFEGIIGKVVQTVAFVIRNNKPGNHIPIGIRLVDFYDSRKYEKEIQFFNPENRYSNLKQIDFHNIPGSPIAYWVSTKIQESFKKGLSIDGLSKFTGSQNITANNEKYLRKWYEIKFEEVGPGGKWVYYAKGGPYRKYYGNLDAVVKWDEDSRAFYANNSTSNLLDKDYWYKEGITYTDITTLGASFRYLPEGCLFDKSGPTISEVEHLYYVLGLLNSNLVDYYLNLLNPTLHVQVKDIKNLPIIIDETKKEIVEGLVRKQVEIAKSNWDSSEKSFEFQSNELLKASNNSEKLFSNIFDIICKSVEEKYIDYKKNQLALNEMFLEIYDLKNEINCSISEKEIPIMIIDKYDNVISFLSYFIGCLVGRYSLDVEGVVYAGGEWSHNKYTLFEPNPNGIVNFTESTYFRNDIILRLREFLAVAFSSDTVDENMQWLAEALEMKKGEDAETRLRRYFLDEFFVDHCKMYQKRPIYWMIDSGKQKGLRTLVYMHRYQPDTMSTIRFEHLQEIQAKYQNEITDLENRLVNPSLSASEKKKLTAEKATFEKKLDELREFDKRLAEIANEEIPIDLDDGVKVNYEKFYRSGKGVLAKIK